MPVFERDCIIDAPVSTVFAYHAASRAFDRLSPPWDDVEVIEPLQRLADGEKAIFKVPVGPVIPCPDDFADCVGCIIRPRNIFCPRGRHSFRCAPLAMKP